MMPRMRDDTLRQQIQYLRECIKTDEALALVVADGWPEPTDKMVNALKTEGFTDEQIQFISSWGPVAQVPTPICCSASSTSWKRSLPSGGQRTRVPCGAASIHCCTCTGTRQAGNRSGGRTSPMRVCVW